ncbi:MAG: putative polysaccharide biosynthesis protein [Bacillota bacterium]
MPDLRQKKFIKGAFTLGTAALIAKLMGFVFRIILPRLIGGEGVGLYQLAYPIYTTLLMVSTSGIPIALAKLISDRTAKNQELKAYRIFRVCLFLNIVIGLLLSLVMFFSAESVIELFKWDNRVFYSVIALVPAVFFVSIVAAYRGFFQGLQNMFPTALSQVVEQFIRIVTMLILVVILLPYGIEYAAAGATFGATTGSIAGLLVLIYIYYQKKEEFWSLLPDINLEKLHIKRHAKKIIYLAAPVTFGALITPLMSFIDAAIVPSRLLAGGFDNVLELYGHLSGMAMVLVHFPTIITLSLATSLMPAISEAKAIDDKNLIQERLKTALRSTIIIALPAAVGLYQLAEPLSTVLFDSPQAAVPLQVMAWSVLFIALKQVSAATLQGMGHVFIPARNLLAGALINAILNFSLTGYLGIRGAALGTLAGFVLTSCLNLFNTYQKTDADLKGWGKLFLRPLLGVLIMVLIIEFSLMPLEIIFDLLWAGYGYYLAVFMIVFIAMFVYFGMLLLLGEIRYSDLILVPRLGQPLADWLLDHGFIKK